MLVAAREARAHGAYLYSHPACVYAAIANDETSLP